METKLKLEAGKYYRTRDGRKAFVLGQDPLPQTYMNEFFIGSIKNDGHVSWAIDGTFDPDTGPSGYDLVAEWTEPKRLSGWVCVESAVNSKYSAYIGPIYATKEQALSSVTTRDRIACIYIDVTEGEGL